MTPLLAILVLLYSCMAALYVGLWSLLKYWELRLWIAERSLARLVKRNEQLEANIVVQQAELICIEAVE